VAKKDKSFERDERRDRLERMRREAERAERRRTLIVVAVCVVIALIIGGLTGWKIYQDSQAEQEVAGTPLDEIGGSASSAGCADVVTRGADGSADHRDGEQLEYPDAPPGFGPHWQTPAEFGRKFYTAADRPEVEQLVHNLEHGYTILWYDQTVADDSSALQVVEDLAGKFDIDAADADIDEYNASKFIAAPWNVDDMEDGEAFPGGAHVALTHWAAEGDDAIEGQGMGVWQYCDQPSGEALQEFMDEYPASNTMEPGAA
jgi:hypothetical protein